MKSAAILVLALLGAANALDHQTKNPNPVEKVVELLTTLKEQLRLDGKSEQQTYDRFACWCTKTTETKAQAITDAQLQVRSLGQTILSYKGSVATLTSEIDEKNSEIQDNKDAQADATAIRQKQNAAWQSEAAEIKQTLKALEMGIEVLTAATKGGAALLQEKEKARAQMAVNNVLDAMPSDTTVGADKISMLSTFATDGYTPQSTSLQGILANMYATFAKDLETSMHDEAQRNKDFEKLIKDKTEQQNNLKDIKSKKEMQKAQEEEILADTTENYDTTKATMEADIEFFDKASRSCKAKSDEMVERKAMRQDESEGIAKALEILSSDDARNLFKSAIKEGKETGGESSKNNQYSYDFLQLSEDESSPVAKAYAILKKHATQSQSLRLAQLAVQVRMENSGHFTPVIGAIDVMIETLNNETRDDIEKRDQCISELHKINSTKKDLQWKIKKNDAKIAKLESLKDMRTKERDNTIANIQQTAKEIKDMEDARVAELEAFQTSKREDEEAIALLIAARDAMSAFYKENKIDFGKVQGSIKLLQQEPDFKLSETDVPEAQLSDKGSRKQQSKGIISIITMIVEDLGDEVSNGVKADARADKDYQEQLHAAKKLMKDLENQEAKLDGIIASRNQQKAEQKTDKSNNNEDLNDELNYEESITPDCSFIMNQFFNRKTAREGELDGLTQAKEALARSNHDNNGEVPIVTSLLQSKKPLLSYARA